MSSTLIASSVSAGSQFTSGSATVENVAQGIFAGDIIFLSMPVPVVAFAGINGRNQVFNFAAGYAPPIGATRLDFTTTLRPVAASGYEPGAFGTQQVANVAQGIFAAGLHSQQIGAHILAPRVFLEQFDFVLTRDPSLAIHFTFSGAAVVAGRGLDSFTAGALAIEGVSSAAPVGLQSIRFGATRIADSAVSGRLVEFSAFATGAPELAIHFRFGGASVLSGSGVESFEVGSAIVENVAQGIFARGFGGSVCGYGVVAPDRSGRNINFNLFELRTQTGANVVFSFGDSRTVQVIEGFSLTDYGTDIRTRFITYPVGLYAFEGLRAFVRRPGEVIPLGVDHLAVGTPSIPKLALTGINSLVFGQTDTEVIAPPAAQSAVFDTGLVSFEVGEHTVSNFYRFVIDVGGVYEYAAGEPWASHLVRTIQTPHDFYDGQAPRFLVGFHQEILAGGLSFTGWGAIDVDVPRISPEGSDSAEFGSGAWLSRAPRYFYPFTHRSLAFGVQKVHNDLQFVHHKIECSMPGEHCGPVFGRESFTRVENRNQTISGYGAESLRTAFWPAAVENAARAYLVTGFESLQYPPFKSWHLIAHRVRYLPIPGTNTFTTVSYNAVHNAGRAIYPVGSDSAVVNNFSYEFLRRFLRDFGFHSLTIPAVRVSRSPRTVAVRTNQSLLQVPRDFLVGLGQQPVSADGFYSFTSGGAYVKGFPIPTLTPYWDRMVAQDQKLFGRGRVWNLTPELFPASCYSFESTPTKHRISFFTRELAPPAIDISRFGTRTIVADTKQFAFARGFVVHTFSQTAFVWNTDPDPPSNRPLPLTGFASLKFSKLEIRLNSIFGDGLNSFDVGEDTTVVNMGVLFEPQHSNEFGGVVFGNPVLSGGVREIHEFSDQNPTTPPEKLATYMTELGWPRVGPHTIWCRLDTPTQAIVNHPESRQFCEVDQFCPGGEAHPFVDESVGSARQGPWFGPAKVSTPSLQVAEVTCNISPPPDHCQRRFWLSGDTQINLRNRAIKPDSNDFMRAGYPTIVTPGTQEVVQWPADEVISQFGEPTVLDMGPQTLENMSGGSMLEFPSSHIENFNRPMPVEGVDFTVFGNNTPMVHFPREVFAGDTEMTLYGLTWASHSPRWLLVDGLYSFDSFWTEYQLRMQVDSMLHRVLGYRYNIFSQIGRPAVAATETGLGPYGINPPCVSPWAEVQNVV